MCAFLHILDIHILFLHPYKKLCLDCVDRCENCNEYIEVKKTVLISGKKYCPDCWNLKKIKCNICQGEYIPKNKEKICPDCFEMKQYIKRLEKINFEAQKFITMSLYNLENVNRCKLFTELYDSCIDLEYFTFPIISLGK